MAGTEFTVSTGAIASTASANDALTVQANANIGFIVNRVTVSIEDLGSETGKALIEVAQCTPAPVTGGSELTEVATGGDSDTPTVESREEPTGGISGQVVVSEKFWPITAQSSCIFDFSALIGRPLKINGGGCLLVRFTGPAGATNSKYTVVVKGEE